jgi:hypothetical protein
MLAALVLVCNLATPVLECDQTMATQYLRVPGTFESAATCTLQAEAYLAGTSIDIAKNEYVKVVCMHSVNPNLG